MNVSELNSAIANASQTPIDFSVNFAMAAGGGGGLGGWTSVLFLVAMIAIFYFMLIRPQSKRAKEQREMMTSLSKGDEVVTYGGLMGKIEEVKENYIDIQIASNVTVTIQKTHVTAVLPKGTMKSI